MQVEAEKEVVKEMIDSCTSSPSLPLYLSLSPSPSPSLSSLPFSSLSPSTPLSPGSSSSSTYGGSGENDVAAIQEDPLHPIGKCTPFPPYVPPLDLMAVDEMTGASQKPACCLLS